MRSRPIPTHAARALLLSVCLAFVAWLVPAAVGRAQSGAPIRFLPRPFGVSLGLDRAYYHEGATARVTFQMQNDTDRDAHGWSAVRGGNGCTFRLTIEDAAGNVVYAPGTGCLFAETTQPLFAGTVLERQISLPLTYRNSAFGSDGTPLAPGAYRVCFELMYFGPMPVLGSPTMPGTNPLVCVPIRIEP